MPMPAPRPHTKFPPLLGYQVPRRLLPDADPFPEIQTFEQSGKGGLWLGRLMHVDTFTGATGQSQEHVIYILEQYYMNVMQVGYSQSEVI